MQSYADFAIFFKAISDETRLRIVEMLFSGEMCACDILANVSISQSTLSYHMKILTECGLVDAVRDGAWMKYSIHLKNFDYIISFLNGMKHTKQDYPRKNC